MRRRGLPPSSSRAASNVYGGYPDIDALYPLQADELDPKKRAAILEKMQRLVHEKAIFAPIWLLAFLNGVGPRVGEVVLRPHRRLPLYGAVRGHNDQGRVAPTMGHVKPRNAPTD